MKALSQRALEELVARSTKAISPILLPFEPDDEDPDGYNMVVVFPVMLRAGGFMLAVPLVPAAQAAIEAIDCGTEGVEPAFHRGALQLETARGRRLGSVDALLADLPWTAISAFSPSGAMKGLPPGEAKAIQFSHEDVLGRPTKQSAEDLATAWISSTLDEETAQEYLTGEEVPELEVVEDPVPRAQEDSGISADVVQALQQRIMELERQVQPTAPPATKVGASPKAPALLNIPASAPNNIDWNRLHQLAGSPPPRIGKPDTNRPVPQKSQALDHVLADVEKEADEIQTGEEGLDLLAQEGDALSKVMVTQLRQNQLLLQKLLGPRYQDPVMGALAGGSGSDSGSASSGVKGCLAREAFIRAMADLRQVAAVTQANAAKELGLTEDRIDGNLMKKYVERRIPIGDNKMVGYLAYMMAEAWMIGWESENVQMLGMVSKVLYFLEQTSLDAGKMQLSWLLTGMAEPPFNLYSNNKRRVGLQPFCRLCHPSWVAANLSYVRDLDILESKMLTMGKPAKVLTQNDDLEQEENPRPKRRPKNPKGKGKKSAEQEDASAI